MVSFLIIGVGAGLLVAIAMLIAQARAQESAWRSISAERRELAEWEQSLITAAESRGCAGCRLRREDA